MQLVPFAALALMVLMVRMLAGGDQLTAALGWLFAMIAVGAGIIWHQSGSGTAADLRAERPRRHPAHRAGRGRRAYLLRFIGGGTLVAIGVIGLAVVYSPVGQSSLWAVATG